MLENVYWLKDSKGLKTEIKQAADEGIISEQDKDIYKLYIQMGEMPEGSLKEEKAGQIFDMIAAKKVNALFPYTEPEEYSEILKSKKGAYRESFHADNEKLYDKIYGGWLGRCAGCLLGKPVEGWYRQRIQGLLHDTGNYPIDFYMASDIDAAIRDKYEIIDEAQDYGNTKRAWINNVSGMPEDDDTNYTVLGLIAAEKYGKELTSDKMGHLWLKSLPILHTCTAERIAYKNIINMKLPPESAKYRNPHREWIGAQIRADAFGYVMPGDPEGAAKLCYEDAALSQVKNGIYGEMWVGAMIALAFCTDDMEKVITLAMEEIPPKSRLYEAIKLILQWYKNGMGYDKVSDKIHEMYDEKTPHDWCHVISNAMIVAAALLYGEKDFAKTIGMATEIGFDTDCNAATAGSVLGVMMGAENLPDKWISPLNDSLQSGVDGLGSVKISEMAKRTLKTAKELNKSIL